MALVELNDTGEPQRRFFGLLRARPPESEEEAAAAMSEPAYAAIEGDSTLAFNQTLPVNQPLSHNQPVSHNQPLVPSHMQPAMYIDPNQTAARAPADGGLANAAQPVTTQPQTGLANTALAQGEPLAQIPQRPEGMAQQTPIPQHLHQQAPHQQAPHQQAPHQQALPQQMMPAQVTPQQMAPQQMMPSQATHQQAGPPPGLQPAGPQHFNAQGVPLQPVPAHLVPQHAIVQQPGLPQQNMPPQAMPAQVIAPPSGIQQSGIQQPGIQQSGIQQPGMQPQAAPQLQLPQQQHQQQVPPQQMMRQAPQSAPIHESPVAQPPIGLAQGMVPPQMVQHAQPVEDPAAVAAAAMAETSEIARGPLDAPASFLDEAGAFERQIFAPNFEMLGEDQTAPDEPLFSGSTYPAVSVAPAEPNVATIQQSSPFEGTLTHSHTPSDEARVSTPATNGTASPAVGQVDFFSIEIDLQPIERSILRNEQVHPVMVDGPERYIPFLTRTLAIVARNFPDVLIIDGGQPLDCLIRVVDDANGASYSLPDVINRRLASIAQQVSTRGPGSISESVQGCPVGISVIDRAGPALGFSTTVGSHRLALSLTGVDHRPFASVDRAGCSAMSVHATGVISAAFGAVVSADRRQAFVEELKLVIETRDWDTELD